jgi:hypothetical protein
MIIMALALMMLGLLGLWLFGGFVLRLAGLLLILAGGVGVAIDGDASGILVAAIGVLLWLAGHWHYALRHQEYKSPLARHFFCRWAPAWLDPTRNWAVAVEADRGDRDNARPGRRATCPLPDAELPRPRTDQGGEP